MMNGTVRLCNARALRAYHGTVRAVGSGWRKPGVKDLERRKAACLQSSPLEVREGVQVLRTEGFFASDQDDRRNTLHNSFQDAAPDSWRAALNDSCTG